MIINTPEQIEMDLLNRMTPDLEQHVRQALIRAYTTEKKNAALTLCSLENSKCYGITMCLLSEINRSLQKVNDLDDSTWLAVGQQPPGQITPLMFIRTGNMMDGWTICTKCCCVSSKLSYPCPNCQGNEHLEYQNGFIVFN